MSQSLEMIFKLGDNKSKTIRIAAHIADISRANVEPVMQKLIDLNVIGDSVSKQLSAIKGATLKETTKVFEVLEAAEDEPVA